MNTSPWGAFAADYTQQATVTDWPVRIALVAVGLGLIALALWGMRRGWRRRRESQSWIAEPLTAPPDAASFGAPVPGLFVGTAIHGDWMDRVVVFDLGVRSRADVSWGQDGLWFEREGARDLFVPAAAVESIRTDRGVAGTVRARDSVIVVTWRLGEAVLDTGFRADDTDGHGTVLDGLTATFAASAHEAGEK